MNDSWFQLRSWSQGHGIEPLIEPLVRLCTECGACLRSSLSLSLCPSSPLMWALSLSLKNKRTIWQNIIGACKKKNGHPTLFCSLRKQLRVWLLDNSQTFSKYQPGYWWLFGHEFKLSGHFFKNCTLAYCQLSTTIKHQNSLCIKRGEMRSD